MATSAPHAMLPEEEFKVKQLLFGPDWENGEKWEETLCELAGMMGMIANKSNMRLQGSFNQLAGIINQSRQEDRARIIKVHHLLPVFK